MALSKKAAQRDGWQYQADHLASTHTAFGMAALMVAEHTRRRPAIEDGTSHARAAEPRLQSIELRPLRLSDVNWRTNGVTQRTNNGNVVALEPQAAKKLLVPRLLNRQVQTLNDLTAAATQRITDLENELDLAQEEIAHRDNENRSLQKSLDLTNDENCRLSKHLVASGATAQQAFAQLKHMKAVFLKVDAERKRTTAAADEANETRRSEAKTLTARLNAMASCAAAADQLLAGMRSNLLEKLELLQRLLQVKECHLNELKQSRSKLLERTKALLETFKQRETALVQADCNIKLLAEQVVTRELDVRNSQQAIQERDIALARASDKIQLLTERVAKSEMALGVSERTIHLLHLELQRERRHRADTVDVHNKQLADFATLQRQLEGYVKSNKKAETVEEPLDVAPGTPVCSTDTKPATISWASDGTDKAAARSNEGEPETGVSRPINALLAATVTF
ncbi:MAG: hypothetical protein WA177_14235 [Xanthobacteraceae bacterium]